MSFAVGSALPYRPQTGANPPSPPVAAPYVSSAQAIPPPARGKFGATGIASFFSGIVGAIAGFVGGIWNKLFRGKKPAMPLDPDSAAIAQAYGLQPTRENVQAFLLEARRYEQDGTLGPGSPDSNAVKQVQQALAAWGFQLTPNGKYDQVTAQAMVQFKQRHNLHQSYRWANGNWAVNEFLDNQTLTKIRELLGTGGNSPINSGPPTGQPAMQPPPAAPGVQNWQAVAAQYGLQATAENVGTFLSEVGTYNAGGALGPGMGPERAEDIRELQKLLRNNFGYTTVTESGAWDQATSSAVIDYKRRNGLHQNYKAADGNLAVNEYADLGTLKRMLSSLPK